MKSTWFKFLKPGIFSLMVLALIVVTTTGCNNEDDDVPQPTQSIVALAQSQSNLSSLVAALTKFPDLVTLLSGSGNFTVFAPTNEAFTSLLQTVGQTNIDDVPESVLESLLRYHVITSGAVLSTQLTAGAVETANGEDIAVTVAGGIRLNGATQVVTPDVRASNGVVHIVNQVLVPPSIGRFVNTVVEPAYFNKNFTTLIAAVNAASPSILEALLSSSRKTLFAPTNAAFQAAGITALPGRATLDAVLSYHVIGSEVRAANLPTNTAPANTPQAMLGGGNAFISNRGAQGVFINGSRVVQADILADNGVVHVIDRTLLPPTQTIFEIVEAAAAANPAQFTRLLQALNRTGVEALKAVADDPAANLTVFAPTDAAFQASGIDLATVSGPNLVAVLQKHITSNSSRAPTGRIFSSDLITGDLDMLNGTVTINASALTVTTGGITANIVATPIRSINILGSNGVVHTIDRVLQP
ncbi:MAG: fasciclin domain-containing protein [Cyclobacteriaceae bacterium]|jgi:transforming growth factor-beta-induced protein|nr:fasciclin domain-containing protein [Cyclobacteriaceae bacterium]